MLTLKAKLDCKACGGSGRLTDWVPYGMGNVPMYSDCDCPYEELSQEEIDNLDNIEYEVVCADGYYDGIEPDWPDESDYEDPMDTF